MSEEATIAPEATPSQSPEPTQPQQPASEPNLFDQGANIASSEKDWLSGIDQQYLSSQTISNAQSPNDLAKQVWNLEKVMGKPKVSLPEDSWTEGDYNEFYNKLGRPETESDYKFDWNSDTVQFSDEDKANLAKSFYDAGLSQQQASKVFKAIGNREVALAESIENKFTETEVNAREMLQKEWGDKFETNLKLSAATLDNLVDAETADRVKERYGNDPHLIKLLAEAGRRMMDDSEFKGNLQSSSWTSPVAAKAEIDQLKMDSTFQSALLDKSNPGHKVALEKWSKLHNTAFPS